MIAYVDSSAVIRRVVDGEGSELVRDVWTRADTVVSGERVREETHAVLDAMRRAGGLDAARYRSAARAAEDSFGDLRLVAMDEALAEEAAELLMTHALRGTDAIHLASALSVDAPRIVVTTWRAPLAVAAAECGMPVVPRPPSG